MVNAPASRRLAGVTGLGAVLLLVVSLPGRAFAQSDPPKPTPPTLAPATPAKPAARTIRVPIDQALLLVRAALLTLNDANRSGNYTVLRDLASPEFSARNTAADLGTVFAEMRKSNLSLYSVLLLSPQLTSAPGVDKDGRLRLAGYVPSRPQQVKFDLVFEQAGGQWKLLNIDISTTHEQPKSPDQQQSEPQRQPQPVQTRKLQMSEPRTQSAKPASAPKSNAPKSLSAPSVAPASTKDDSR